MDNDDRLIVDSKAPFVWTAISGLAILTSGQVAGIAGGFCSAGASVLAALTVVMWSEEVVVVPMDGKPHRLPSTWFIITTMALLALGLLIFWLSVAAAFFSLF